LKGRLVNKDSEKRIQIKEERKNMAWLEMSRTPDTRPVGWRVGECLWSPQRKTNENKTEGTRWGFWETLLSVKRGDVIFHLCGRSRKASFTGFSVADEEGQPIEEGPLGPEKLYRVALRDYSVFEKPITWESVQLLKHKQLLDYFVENRTKGGKAKEKLFYVQQSGSIRCLNGAYLSYLSDQLVEILFGVQTKSSQSEIIVQTSAQTGTALRNAAVRVGHQKFSDNVKANFCERCCFPGCSISDRRFLVGAHIARWADVAELRGKTENGLCLCVFHDRAFETGVFTFDQDLKVRLLKCEPAAEWVQQFLAYGAGRKIGGSSIAPTVDMLSHHWKRHGFEKD
jgi:putative restriction endonuclease